MDAVTKVVGLVIGLIALVNVAYPTITDAVIDLNAAGTAGTVFGILGTFIALAALAYVGKFTETA